MDKQIPEWAVLGRELIENALYGTAIEEGEKLLNTVGVDSALYMLFAATMENSSQQGLTSKEIRALMQGAFMLGTYVYKSVKDVEKLW
jgi:hypothetical protein